MRFVKAKNLRQVLAQIVNEVTDAAHAELAEITQVFSICAEFRLNCSANSCDEMVLIPAAASSFRQRR